MIGNLNACAVVLAAIALDFASGMAKGAATGSLDSKVMREGLYHKAAYVIVLAAAALIEYGEGVLDLGYSVPIVLPACAYVVITELVSVVENVGEINPAIKGSKLLGLFKGQGEKDEG